MLSSIIVLPIKKALKICRNHFVALLWRFFYAFKLIKYPKSKIKFVIEGKDWAIQRVGESIAQRIKILELNCFELTTKPFDSAGQIVHFGSQYMWLDWADCLPSSNKYVVSFFHVKYEDSPKASK